MMADTTRSTPAETGRHHLAALDGLRGVAAIVVLIYHFGLWTGQPLAPLGYLSVDFFFMLSGFVIALSYEDRLRDGRLGPLAFARRRVIRLYPVVLLGAALGAIVNLALRTPASAIPSAWGILLLLPAFTPAELFPWNGPFWSLLSELAANAVHALALHRLRLRWLVLMVTLAAGGIGGVMLWAGWLNVGWSGSDWFCAVPRVAFGYGIGMVAYRLRASRRLPERWVPPWIAPAIILALLIPFHGHARPLGLAFVLILFPIALVAALRGGSLGRIERKVHLLGMLSFPLYAIQYPLIVAGTATLPLGPGHAAISVAFLLAILLLSAAVGRWYDPAGQRLLRRLWPEPGPRPAA